MSQDRKQPRFRHRIKDLMILNAVLAISLGLSIGLSNTIRNKLQIIQALVAGLFALPFVMLVIVGPLAVEFYLYRKGKGTWYQMKNPGKPPLRYQRPTDLPPYLPSRPVQDERSRQRSRTRLFGAGSPSEPVSRASILMTVASQFEASGRMNAAAQIYHQVLERFPDSAEAQDAARRLQSLSNKNASVLGSRED
jgi:hypothetical protein